MSDKNARLQILEMIENGLITASEGIKLLEALAGRAEESQESPATIETKTIPEIPVVVASPVPEAVQGATLPEISSPEEPAVGENPPLAAEPSLPPSSAPQPEEPPEEASTDHSLSSTGKYWRRWWWVPMWVGVGITLVASLLMYWAWSANGFGFWFACTWFPFLLGVVVMALAWASRRARWLHLRVHQAPGESPRTIAISLPLPLRLTAWFLRMFGHHIPHMENTALDEVIMALEYTSPEQPFFLEVNEGEDGEKVEIYIG